ncbi:TPA: NAD(P)H-dependent oxidoreductase [Burkholderia cenocepacia]|uniref:FMN-dependent NADH-azoreductase n=1 Tax=unclassified Burkholderia TaxID=2613784 RepID=UPI00158BB0ED|nr:MULTISPECIES: NAD(P)H-dependent oxidoreductase [unclassified Burkholderia]HEF5875340.1 NAD(P)H-dependent oxidoreductase [Burkholderia cenocepacia]
MTSILQIDSSILGAHSASRELTAETVARQVALHPGATIVHRDLAADSTLHLSGQHLAAFQGATPESSALGEDIARGAAYIDDLFAADVIVIGAPMYNFTVPSQLKSWIDRVLVAGRTFRYTENGAEGLLPAGKKVYVVSTRGGVYTGGSPAASLDFQEGYLRAALAFIGLTDVSIIRAEGLAISEEAKASAITSAKAEIKALVV